MEYNTLDYPMPKTSSQRSLLPFFFLVSVILSLLASVQAGIHPRIPLGPMGAEADLTVDSPELVVKSVTAGSPASLAGLLTGDIILGVNGTTFEHYVGGSSYSGDTLMGGEGSPRILGLAIDQAEGGNGQLTLNVRRGNSDLNLTITLPTVGSFSPTFPYACQKSDALYSAVANRIIATQLADGTWPDGLGGDWAGPTRRRYTSSWLGLVLLGKNDTAYRPAINKVRDYLLQPDFKCNIDDDFTVETSWVNNWGHVMAGIYLCEYVRITGDNNPNILGGIKRISDALTFRVTTSPAPNPGHMGHGYGGDYGGSGINIINTQAHIFWALAKDLGIEQDDAKIALSLNHVKNSIGSHGGVMYTRGDSDMDSGGRSGAFAIALSLMDDETTTLNQINNFLGSRVAGHANAHANSSFGIAYSAIAMHKNSPEDFRRFMDEWRWWFALSRKPEGWSGYIGGRGHVGGDSYLGYDSCGLFQIGSILACRYGNLKIGGNAHSDHFTIRLQQPASSPRYVIANEGIYFNPTYISYNGQVLGSENVTTSWSKISGPGNLLGVIPSSQGQSLRFDSPGNYKVRLSATHHTLSLHRDFDIEVLPTPADSATLSQWNNGTVGDEIGDGGYTINGETVQFSGSAGDIWSGSDDFHYRYKRLRNDCSITVKLDSFSSEHPWARAGIMMRKSLDAGSPHVMLCQTKDHGYNLHNRLLQDGGSGQNELTESSPWLRLVRRGFGVHAFVSSDGNIWTWVGTRPLLATDEIYVGIACSSISTGSTLTASFSNVTTTGTEPFPVPILEVDAPDSSAGELFLLKGNIDPNWPTPSDPLVTFWTQISGPENASFFTPQNLETTVQVTLPGTYTFRLIAYDGYHAGAKDVTVQVTSVGTYTLAKAVELDGQTVTSSPAAPWRVDLLETSDGHDAAISPPLGANQSTTLTATITADSVSTLRFRWMASTEPHFDPVRFAIDGVELATLSGQRDWSLVELPITSGTHTLTWTYSTDAFGEEGTSQVGVDQIEIISQAGLTASLASAVGLTNPVDSVEGNAPWQIATGQGYPSGNSIRSGLIEANETSSFSITHNGAGPVSFVWKVSSEEDADFLEFLVDGSVVGRISGNHDWHEYSTSLAAGSHVLQWRYIKDGSVSRYQDTGWVDNISFTAPTGTPVATRTELPGNAVYTLQDSSGGSPSPTPVDGAITYSPWISVKHISFGGTPSGTSVDADLTIHNRTNNHFSVLGHSSLPSQLSFPSSPTGVINANSSTTFKVSFTPTTAQTYSGSFTLNLSNGTNVTILWKGLGTATGDLILKPATITANLGYGHETTRLMTIANHSGEEKQWSLSQFNAPQPELTNTLANFNNTHSRISELIPDRYDFAGGDTGNSIRDSSVGLNYNFNYFNTNTGSQIPYSDNLVTNSISFGTEGAYFTRKQPGLLLFVADTEHLSYFTTNGTLSYNSNQTIQAHELEATVGGKTYRGILRSSSEPNRATVHQLFVTDSGTATFYHDTGYYAHIQLNNLLQQPTRIYGLTFMQSAGKTMSAARLQDLFETFIETLITGTENLVPIASSGTISPGQHLIVPVKVNTSGLEAGNHTLNLHLFSGGIADTSQFNITVTAPDIAINTDKIFINTAPGSAPDSVQLEVTGNAPSWSATSSESWVKLTPSGPTLPAQLDISFNNPPITPGLYKIQLEITSETSRQLVTLYYSVTAPHLSHLVQDHTRPHLYGLGNIEGKSYLLILSSISGDYLKSIPLADNSSDMVMTPAGTHLFVPSFADSSLQKIDLRTQQISQTYPLTLPDNASNATRYNLAALSENKIWLMDGQSSRRIHAIDLDANTTNELPVGTKNWTIASYIPQIDRVIAAYSNSWNSSTSYQRALSVHPTLFTTTISGSDYYSGIPMTNPHSPTLDGQTIVQGRRLLNSQSLTEKRKFNEVILTQSAYGKLAVGKNKLFNAVNGTEIYNHQKAADLAAMGHNQERVFIWSNSTKQLDIVELGNLFPLEPARFKPHIADNQYILTNTPGLSWNASPYTSKYRVYFDSDYNTIRDAGPSSPSLLAETSETSVDFNTTLSPNSTYYWRVDRINEHGVHTGSVLTFSTTSLQLSNTSIDLAGFTGHNLAPVNIDVLGIAGTNWQITTNTPWLTANIVDAGTPGSLTLTADTSGLTEGVHEGSITLIEGAKAIPVTVKLHIISQAWTRFLTDHRQNCIWALQPETLTGRATLAKVNPVDGSLIAAHILDPGHYAMSLSPDQRSLFLINSLDRTLHRFNPVNLKETGQKPLPDEFGTATTTTPTLAAGANHALYYSTNGTTIEAVQWDNGLRPAGFTTIIANRVAELLYTAENQTLSAILLKGTSSSYGPVNRDIFSINPDATLTALRSDFLYNGSLGNANNFSQSLTGSHISFNQYWLIHSEEEMRQGTAGSAQDTSLDGSLITKYYNISKFGNNDVLQNLGYQTHIRFTPDQQSVIAWSSSYKTFTVTAIDESIRPALPGLKALNPTAGGGLLPEQTQLKWQRPTTAERFRIFLANSAGELTTSPPIAERTQSTYILTEGQLEPNQNYHWRVDWFDGENWNSGPEWQFHTIHLTLGSPELRLNGALRHTLDPIDFPVQNPSTEPWSVTSNTTWLTATKNGDKVSLTPSYPGISAGPHLAHITLTQGDHSAVIPVIFNAIDLNITSVTRDDSDNAFWAIHHGAPSYLCKIDPSSARITHLLELPDLTTALALSPAQDKLYGISYANDTAFTINRANLSIGRTINLPEQKDETSTGGYYLAAGHNGILYYNSHPNTSISRLAAVDFATGQVPTGYTTPNVTKPGAITYLKSHRTIVTIPGIAWGASSYSNGDLVAIKLDPQGQITGEVTHRTATSYTTRKSIPSSWSNSVLGQSGGWLSNFPDHSLYHATAVAHDVSGDGNTIVHNYYFYDAVTSEILASNSVGHYSSFLHITPDQDRLIWWNTSNKIFQGNKIPDSIVLASPGQAPLAPLPDSALLAGNETLHWQGIPTASLYRVYLGTSASDLTSSSPLAELSSTNFTVPAGQLTLGQSHLWRVDWFDGSVWHTGPKWSFTYRNSPLASSRLSFAALKGNTHDPHSINVNGVASSPWSVSSNSSWITVEKNGTSTFLLTASAINLPKGLHNGSITLTISGQSMTIDVDFNVITVDWKQLLADSSQNCIWALSSTPEGYLAKVSPDGTVNTITKTPLTLDQLELSPLRDHLYGISSSHETLVEIDRNSLSIATQHAIPPHGHSDPGDGSIKHYHLTSAPNGIIYYNTNPWSRYSSMGAYNFNTAAPVSGFIAPDSAVEQLHYVHAKELLLTSTADSTLAIPTLSSGLLDNNNTITRAHPANTYAHTQTHPIKSSWSGDTILTPYGAIIRDFETGTYSQRDLCTDLSGSGVLSIAGRSIYDNITAIRYSAYLPYSTNLHTFCPDQQTIIAWSTSTHTFHTTDIASSYPDAIQPMPGLLALHPVDQGVTNPTHSTLRWQHPEKATKFRLYFDTTGTPLGAGNYIGEFTTNSHSLPAFSPNTSYHWRVDWSDGVSWHTGPNWSFSVPKIAPDTHQVELVTFGTSFTSTAQVNVSGLAGADWTATSTDTWMVINTTSSSTPGSFTISSNATYVSPHNPLQGTVTLSDGDLSLEIDVTVNSFSPIWENLIADHRQNCLWAVDERYIAKINQSDGSIQQVIALQNPGSSIAITPNHRWLYALDQRGTFYKINPVNGTITSTNQLQNAAVSPFKRHFAIGPENKAYTYTETTPATLLVIDLSTGNYAQDPVPLNTLHNISRVHYDKAGNRLFFVNGSSADNTYINNGGLHTLELDAYGSPNGSTSVAGLSFSYWQLSHYPTSSWDGQYVSASTELHHTGQPAPSPSIWSSGIRDIAYDGSLIVSNHLYDRDSGDLVVSLPSSNNVAAITPNQQSVIVWNSSSKEFTLTSIPEANRSATPALHLLSPADGSLVGSSNPLLHWMSNPIAETFKLFLGTNIGNLTEIVQTIQSNHVLNSLSRATQYFWKISWFDGATWSDTEVDEFTTSGFLVDSRQVLIESIVGNIPDASTLQLDKDAALTVTATTDTSWLDASVDGNTVSLTLNANAPQTWGDHTATLTLQGGSDTVEIPVILSLEKLIIKHLLKDIANNRLLAYAQTSISKRNQLIVLDGTRMARFIPLPNTTTALHFTPDCTALYGTTSSPEGVFKITSTDLASYNWKATTDTASRAFSPDNSGKLYLSHQAGDSSTLTMLDFDTLSSEVIATVSGNASYMGIPKVSRDSRQLAIISKTTDPLVSVNFYSLPYSPSNSPQTYQMGGNYYFQNIHLISTTSGKRWHFSGSMLNLDDQTPVITSFGTQVYDLSANGEHYLSNNGLYDTTFKHRVSEFSAHLAVFNPDHNSILSWNSSYQTLTSTAVTDPNISRAEEFYSTPSDGEHVPSNLAQLQWNSPYGAHSYRVYMGNSASGVAAATPDDIEFLEESTTTTHSISPLTPGTHYWRVDILTNAGWQTGEVTSFTVTELALLGLSDTFFETFTNRTREWTFTIAHPAGKNAICTPSEPWVNATTSPGADNSHTKVTLTIGGADVPTTITPVTLELAIPGASINVVCHTSTSLNSFNPVYLSDSDSHVLGRHNNAIFEYRKSDGVIDRLVEVPLYSPVVSHDVDTLDACAYSNRDVWYHNASSRESHSVTFENYVRNSRVFEQDLILVGEYNQIHLLQPSTGIITASIPAHDSQWDYNPISNTLLCKSIDRSELKKYTVSSTGFHLDTSIAIDSSYNSGALLRVPGSSRFVCGNHLLEANLDIIMTSSHGTSDALTLMAGGLLRLYNQNLYDRLTNSYQNIGSWPEIRLPSKDGSSIIKLIDNGVEIESLPSTYSTNANIINLGYILPGTRKGATFQIANLSNAPLTINAPSDPGSSAEVTPAQTVDIPAFGVQTYTLHVQPLEFSVYQASTTLTIPAESSADLTHTAIFTTIPPGTTGSKITLTFEDTHYPQQGMLLESGYRRLDYQTNANTAKNGTAYVYGYNTLIPMIRHAQNLPFDLLSIDLASVSNNPGLPFVVLVGTKPDGSTVTANLAVDPTLVQENDFTTYTTELSEFTGIVSLTFAEGTKTAAMDNVRVEVNESAVADIYDYMSYHDNHLAPLGVNHLPLQDYDSDGVANIIEWLHGSDPLSADILQSYVTTHTDGNGDSFVTLQRRKNLLPGALTLEWSNDMITWNPAQENVDHKKTHADDIDAATERVTYKVITPASRRFYRTRFQTQD